MHRYKVRIKRSTYDGDRWNTTSVHAENFEDCFRKVERDFRLQDCLDYKVDMKELAAEE